MATLNGDGQTMSGKYIILDTTVGIDRSVAVPQLSGRQGDNGRLLFFQIMDGNVPHNMDGQKLVLVGKDNTGTPKVADSMTAIDSSAGGRVQFKVPGQFYQADGPYNIAYFQIKKTDTDEVISTINVNFEVLESATIMTTGQSEIYNSEMLNRIETLNSNLAPQLKALETQVTNEMSLVKTAQQSLNALLAAANRNAFAGLGVDNEFTGNNHFKGTTTIDNLQGNAITNLRNEVNNNIKSLSDSVSNLMAGKLMYTDRWTRDYTLSGALSRANNGNDFALSRFQVTDDFFIILGRGDVRVDFDTQFAESTINLPWKVDNADVAFAQCYFRGGYALPRLNVNSKTIAISWKEPRHEICRLSLVIFAYKH